MLLYLFADQLLAQTVLKTAYEQKRRLEYYE